MTYTTRMHLTMITETEINVLKVMAEKDINWNWMNLDRTLSIRQIPGFGNVVNIVNKLANEGLVIIEDSGCLLYTSNSSVNRFSQKKQKDTLPKGLTFFRDTHHHDANALHKFTHQK